MDHTEAVRLKAAERYLLGELRGEQREQYEEHFFKCTECALDLNAGATFIDSAREVLATEPVGAADAVKQGRLGWFAGWLRPALAVPALAGLIMIVGYQNALEIPKLKTAEANASAPRLLRTYTLIQNRSQRGGSKEFSVPFDRTFALDFDIPVEGKIGSELVSPRSEFESYRCDIESESGAVEFSFAVTAEEATNAVHLLIPASKLRPGQHNLVVRGVKSAQGPGSIKEVARFPFTLESTQ